MLTLLVNEITSIESIHRTPLIKPSRKPRIHSSRTIPIMSVLDPFKAAAAGTRSSSVATERGSVTTPSVRGTPAPSSHCIDLTGSSAGGGQSSRAASVAAASRQASVAPAADIKPVITPSGGGVDRQASVTPKREPSVQPAAQPTRAPSASPARTVPPFVMHRRRSASVSTRPPTPAPVEMRPRAPSQARTVIRRAAVAEAVDDGAGSWDGRSDGGSELASDVFSHTGYAERHIFQNQRALVNTLIPTSRGKTEANNMGPPPVPNKAIIAELEHLREENADLRELRAYPLPRFSPEALAAAGPNVVTDEQLCRAQSDIIELFSKAPGFPESSKKIALHGLRYATYLHAGAWQAIAPITVDPPRAATTGARRPDVRGESSQRAEHSRQRAGSRARVREPRQVQQPSVVDEGQGEIMWDLADDESTDDDSDGYAVREQVEPERHSGKRKRRDLSDE